MAISKLDDMLNEASGLRHCCGQPTIQDNEHWKAKIISLVDEIIGEDEGYPQHQIQITDKKIRRAVREALLKDDNDFMALCGDQGIYDIESRVVNKLIGIKEIE